MTQHRLPSALPLTAADEALIDAARATIDGHGDEAGVHTVAAAVRSADGSVHVGVNLYHFLGGPCAELVALGAARAHGATKITHIVAVGDQGRGVLNPCGRDRQILSDCHPNVRVVVTDRGELTTVSVSVTDLLPLAYDAVAAQD